MLFALSFILTCKLEASEILSRADEFRSPSGGFSLLVDVRELDEDRKSSFEVFIKNNNKSLMLTKEPSRDRGRNLLMLDRDMWIFIPRIKRPVRVGLRQRLMGDVANGDLSRLQWTGDYSAQIDETNSRKFNQQPSLKLVLKAQKENLTYEKIHLWVLTSDYRPLFAEYLTPSGKVLKTSTFENYGPLAGKTRPRRMLITDAMNQESQSEILIREMKKRSFPEGFFTQSNLEDPRL